MPTVPTTSGDPSSHILGEHYLQQETTEDPAKSCYGLRLSEKLLSSTSVDEIMYLDSKEQSPRVLAERHSLSSAVWPTSVYMGQQSKHTCKERDGRNIFSNMDNNQRFPRVETHGIHIILLLFTLK